MHKSYDKNPSLAPVIAVFVLLLCALVGLDQYTKHLAQKHLYPAGYAEAIKGFLAFTYTENTGAAFGILEGARLFFLFTTGTVIIGLVVYYLRFYAQNGFFTRAALVFAIAGSLGNFIDRLRFGRVIDFLMFTFFDFPIFNLADVFIVTGVLLFLVMTVKNPSNL